VWRWIQGAISFIADAGNNRVVELPAGGGAQITVPVSGLHGLAGVAADGAGDVFIAAAGNSRVVEVPYLGNGMYGTQITVSSGLYSPVGVAVDGAGDLFITDSGRVVEIQRVAGNVAINFGSTNVCPEGQTTPAPCSQTLPLTYNVAAYTTVFATQVVTEGAPGLDFTTSDNNCVGYYNAATTCIVNVTFAPLAPGVRMGAVQFTGNWSYLPVTNMIYGVGEGPVIAFAPSVQSTVPANGLSTPRGVAVDGAGDILIADTGNNWVLMVQADGAQTTVGYGLNFPYGVAVDGAGDVFIADTGNSRVAEVPTYCLYCLNPVPVSGLNSPAGVAVDGAGDLFIADTGNNRVVEVPAGGGAQITVGSGLNSPSGVAVDGTGNVFIADTGNSRVVEVPAGGGAQITVPVSGLNSPTGVAVDAAGDLFIADAGNNRVVEVPYLGNGMYGAQITVGSGLRSPKGVALDGAGDVFIADSGNSRVVKLQRSQPPTLTFASTPVGSTSSDSPQAVTVQNIGNQPLEGYPSGWLGADFFQVANSGSQASCIPSFQLTPGTSCLMSISFEPQSTGSLTATQRFADNTLNLSGFSASQNVTLQGTGLPTVQATATALWSSQNPSISGQAVAFTATIYPQVGGEVTGTVTFKNGNAALATVAVSGNAASLTTSALKAGVHSISAVYSGNANFTGSTSAPLSQLVQNPAVTATWTVLTSSVNPSVSGKPVLFTATVSPQSGAGTPTGKVTFYNGSAELSTVGLSSGTAKYSTTALPAGSNRITAVYGGDTNYSGSTSAAVNQYVIATTTVTLTSSLNPSTYGQALILQCGGHFRDRRTAGWRDGHLQTGHNRAGNGKSERRHGELLDFGAGCGHGCDHGGVWRGLELRCQYIERPKASSQQVRKHDYARFVGEPVRAGTKRHLHGGGLSPLFGHADWNRDLQAGNESPTDSGVERRHCIVHDPDPAGGR
jgi:sugar lactone lactonase YvrE